MVYFQSMKAKIHPEYFPDAQVSCVCGNSFTIGSTSQIFRVDICHKCHPFYTGEMKFIDTMGRVERFQKRQEEAKKTAPILAAKKQKKLARGHEEEKRTKSLREMLMGVQ